MHAGDMGRIMPKLIWHIEDLRLGMSYQNYYITQLASKFVKVVLSGAGGDELFAGYHYFYGFYIKGLIRKGKFIKAIKEIYGLLNGGDYKIGIYSIGFLFIPLFIRRVYFSQKSVICKSLLRDKEATTSFFKDYYRTSSLHDALKFHLDCKLEHLLKWEDRNSMAHSREARVPFLDIVIMSFVFKLPEDFIISQGKTKSIVRDAMKGIVPSDILNRRDKIGFATPMADWLREQSLKKLLKSWFINNDPLSKKYIDLKKLRKKIYLHLKEKKNYGRVIWKSLFLEAWLKAFRHRIDEI